MAELTQFILGNLSADFMQLKTSDNIYLKDLLMQDLGESLEVYNNRTLALSNLMCNKYDDAMSQQKKVFTNDGFSEIGEIETPVQRTQFDVWNYPVPIKRYGSLTKMTLESVKKMTSSQIIKFHDAKLIADQKNLVKSIFQAGTVKAPAARVDALDGLAATAKAFWNADGVDTPRPNGQITFTNTHNHYLIPGTADSIGTNGAELDTLIAHIMEHEGISGSQIFLFAKTGLTANKIKNETTNFRPINLSTPFISGNPSFNDSGRAQPLITPGMALGWNLKVVGTWKEAIVVETPDLPEYYIFAIAFQGNNAENAPLAWREHPAFKGLMILSPSGQNPLIGQDSQYRRYLGIGVKNRSAGACLYLHSNSAWAEPTYV